MSGRYLCVGDVHGHRSVPEVRIRGNNINVDTGCGRGGLLSAILLPDMKIISSRSQGESAVRREWRE